MIFAPVLASAQKFPKLPKMWRFSVHNPEPRLPRFSTEITRTLQNSVKFTTNLPLRVKNPSLSLRADALRFYNRVLVGKLAPLKKAMGGNAILYDDFTMLPTETRFAFVEHLVPLEEELDALSLLVDPNRDPALKQARTFVRVSLSTLQSTLLFPPKEVSAFAARADRQLVETEFFLNTPIGVAAGDIAMPKGLTIAVVMDDSSDLLRMEAANQAGTLFAGNTLKIFENGSQLVEGMLKEQFVPDVVLTNTFMAGRIGGYALTAMLRRQGFNKTIIALDAEEPTPQMARELHVLNFDGLISLDKHFTNPQVRAGDWQKRLNEALANYYYYKNKNGWAH